MGEAYEKIVTGTMSYTAEAALSSTNYRFVKLGTNDDQVTLCGAGEQMIGVRRNSPAINQAVEVVGPGNVAKITLGGTVTKGAWVKSDAAGAAVAATTDADIVGGIALQGGSSGEVVSILVQIGTYEAA